MSRSPKAAAFFVPSFHLLIVTGEAALRSFLVERRYVFSSFFQGLHYLVERHAMTAIGESGVDIGIQGTSSGIGVALDAGNLYEAADGVASHTQMMFQSHFGSVFNLCGATPKQLVGGSGSHSTGNAHLTLAAYLSSRDRGIGAHDVAH